MSSNDLRLLIPGPNVILCPDCQQLVGKGAEKYHAKNCSTLIRRDKEFTDG